jgi:hypothetical protein
MDYLDIWNKGFDEGKAIQINLINSHCGTDFKSLTEIIIYIREVEFNKRLEAQNA